MSDTILALNKATKLYAGVPAIDCVDFDLQRGEIHALVGETSKFSDCRNDCAAM